MPQLIGSDVNIEDFLMIALDSNDLPSFIRDVRKLLKTSITNPDEFLGEEVMDE